jgi:hypothetical protein
MADDPVNKNLLIACKGHPFLDEKNGSGFKAIYSFSPDGKLYISNEGDGQEGTILKFEPRN